MVGDFVVAIGHQTVAVCWLLLTRSPLYGGMDAWFLLLAPFCRVMACCLQWADVRPGVMELYRMQFNVRKNDQLTHTHLILISFLNNLPTGYDARDLITVLNQS